MHDCNVRNALEEMAVIYDGLVAVMDASISASSVLSSAPVKPDCKSAVLPLV